MIVLPKAISRLNAISIKTPISLITETWKNYPKIHVEPQKILKRQNNPEQKNSAGEITIPDLKIHYWATVINNTVLEQKQTSRPVE